MGSNPQEVIVSPHRRGNDAVVYLGEIALMGDASELIDLLRWLIEQITPPASGWRQAHAVGRGLPTELADPETAWPYLVDRFPWLFDGIDTSREPYAQYLRKSAKTGQISTLAADLQALGENPSLADISEIVFGSRYYSGSQYAQLKKIQSDLAVSSSSDGQKPVSDTSEDLKQAA